MRLGLLLGLLCAGAGLGGIELGLFLGTSSFCLTGKKILPLSGSELSLTLSGSLLCKQCLE